MNASTRLVEPNYKLDDLFPIAYSSKQPGKSRYELTSVATGEIFRTDDASSIEVLRNLAKDRVTFQDNNLRVDTRLRKTFPSGVAQDKY
ncbi:MAG: hypothetical protein Q7R87_04870 [Nanoarchaeota archaeon]|nr:hypothetical protein [Nanoarchaeota archaeon]